MESLRVNSKRNVLERIGVRFLSRILILIKIPLWEKNVKTFWIHVKLSINFTFLKKSKARETLQNHMLSPRSSARYKILTLILGTMGQQPPHPMFPKTVLLFILCFLTSSSSFYSAYFQLSSPNKKKILPSSSRTKQLRCQTSPLCLKTYQLMTIFAPIRTFLGFAYGIKSKICCRNRRSKRAKMSLTWVRTNSRFQTSRLLATQWKKRLIWVIMQRIRRR